MNRHHYLPSRYTILFRTRGKEYLCYNSRSNSFLSVSEGLYNLLSTKQTIDITLLEESVLKQLVDLKIIVQAGEDEAYLKLMKVKNNIHLYSKNHLGLTIVPTTGCNLRCPYCFETKKINKTMTDDTIQDLIVFINRHKEAKEYSICWYGGEPLLVSSVIGKIIDKIEKEVSLNFAGHTMVSNGVLLTDNVFNVLRKKPLNNIQITFDGAKESHDKKRYFPNHKGTFEIIRNNLKRFAKEFPETTISIRINIDNQNKEEYFSLSKSLYAELNEFSSNVFIYPGVLRNENPNSGICSNHFMSNRDLKDFYFSLSDRGASVRYFPIHRSKGCSANSISDYVIGPEGEIYRCWLEVGDTSCVIGHITDSDFENPQLYVNYQIDGDCFNSQTCLQCSLLPICSGGCPHNRLQNMYNNAQIEICPLQHDNNLQGLHEILEKHYLMKMRTHEQNIKKITC